MQTTAAATAAPLDNPVRAYAWGSTTAIPDLLGLPPTGEPQAELWLGAHPSEPSRIRRGGRSVSLLDRIEAAPERELGPDVTARFGPRLPYLLKVIAAAAPLSLQAHPNAEQAAAGYAEENDRGVPLAAPQRNYRDPHHKPELLCALTPFDALCGFRAVPRTLRLLDELVGTSGAAPTGSAAGRAAEVLGPCVAALRARPDGRGLREVVTGLLTLPADRRPGVVEAVAAACALPAPGTFAADRATAVDLASAYPGDVGVVVALLLNRVRLQPGDAVFLPAGNLHSYLGGTGVEIMANSDNVLRGGLTSKHVVVAELLRVLDTADGPATTPHPRAVAGAGDADGWGGAAGSGGSFEAVYDVPVAEFRLSRVTVAGGPLRLEPEASPGPQILLVTEGAVSVSGAGEPLELARGESAWVPAAATAALAGEGTVFRATTNLGAAARD